GPETGATRTHDDGVVRVLVDVHVRILPSRSTTRKSTTQRILGDQALVAVRGLDLLVLELELEHEWPRFGGRDGLHRADEPAAVGADRPPPCPCVLTCGPPEARLHPRAAPRGPPVA